MRQVFRSAVGAFGYSHGIDFMGARGIISGKPYKWRGGVLQTVAAINLCNSGGPLIDLTRGKVVDSSRPRAYHADDTDWQALNRPAERVRRSAALCRRRARLHYQSACRDEDLFTLLIAQRRSVANKA